MADDKELQIRLQFLDEAQEYLDTMSTRLIGIAQGFDGETINDALRAAHSVKGGAALMGFETLSGLAHRLEDGLKVLKVQRGKVAIDASLESQLLTAIDRMGQVMQLARQDFDHGESLPLPIDENWLAQDVYPIFDELHERLGEPEEEDAHSMLTPEDGQDIIPLLFQSEVEGCLQRLEEALATNSACLKEEAQILAQELAGLGEMLQLPDFTRLCQVIGAQMGAIADNQLQPTVRAALDTWRTVQAQVINGTYDHIPTAFTGSPEYPLEPLSAEQIAATFTTTWPEVETDAAIDATSSSSTSGPDLSEVLHGLASDELTAAAGAAAVDDFDDFYIETQLAAANGQTGTEEQTADASAAASAPTDSDSDSTVRVPVKQINQLSDLFGELVIERNRLEVEIKRLRGLVSRMQGRMRTLDGVSSDLRDVYDRVATQSQPQWLPSPEAEPVPVASPRSDTLQAFDVLELDRYGEVHLPFREVIETIVQLQEVGEDIDFSLDQTEQTTRGLRKTSRQLQKYLTQLRMRPLGDIFQRFPRALRQMSLQYGKSVELKTKGEHTLVDRNVLEALQDPLMHIIRNCFDHGIEPPEIRQQRGKPESGTITVTAQQRSGRTSIIIQDDGGGIPLDQIRDRAVKMGLDSSLLAAASKQDLLSLIFEPGFSTASEVTDLSGRGVGMDVVRSRLKEIRGDIQVDTESGVGTTFAISIPFTLSVTRVLIVESRGMRMAFSVDAVEEMFSLTPEQILSTAGKDSFEWNGELLQLVRLSDWLQFNCPVSLESPEISPAISQPTVLLVQYNQRLVGIQIDRSWGEQEVALRRVMGNLPLPVGFNSCTILGDGHVVPLVAVPELLYWIASCEASGAMPTADSSLSTYLPTGTAYDTGGLSQKPTVLLIDDSINVRRFIALTLEKAGYQVAQAKDGQDALDKLMAGLAVDAIICDVEMPRLDGYGFLSRIKANTEHQQIPVAMLTSRGSPKHRKMAIELGAEAYFTKPYNEQTLLQTLEDLIEPALVS